MLCKECREKFGESYRYLIDMIEAYDTKGDKGMEGLKTKFIYALTGDSEIYKLKKRIKELEKKVTNNVI